MVILLERLYVLSLLQVSVSNSDFLWLNSSQVSSASNTGSLYSILLDYTLLVSHFGNRPGAVEARYSLCQGVPDSSSMGTRTSWGWSSEGFPRERKRLKCQCCFTCLCWCSHAGLTRFPLCLIISLISVWWGTSVSSTGLKLAALVLINRFLIVPDMCECVLSYCFFSHNFS